MMAPLEFSAAEQQAARRLIEWALDEDLGTEGDVTTAALIDADERGTVTIVAREAGVLAGIPVARLVFSAVDPEVTFAAAVEEGAPLEKGTVVARLSGPVRSLLTGERTALNFLTHLSGVASLTRRYVALVAGTNAAVFDTRKTLPGWRLLEKYAVRAGGGRNHRIGLYDMVLIKDNHLAAWRAAHPTASLAEAIAAARARSPREIRVEIEVDTLLQLEEVLPGRPDIVLLDNMSCDVLAQAVALRNVAAPEVALEASGGVNLATVAEIARTGVERISIGALTHSAIALDLAFDWE